MKKRKPITNNLWNSCPEKVEFYPVEEAGCEKGKAQECDWSIKSPEHGDCFWTWVREASDQRGYFKPLFQHETATLLGLSAAKINEEYKAAWESMKSTPEYEILKSVFFEEEP